MENNYFEFFEHTADIGIRVYGKDFKAVFENSAKALFSIVTDFSCNDNEVREFDVQSGEIEDLLVYFLNSLLSQFYTEKFLPVGYEINIDKDKYYKVYGKCFGQHLDDLAVVKTEVKAVTYHDLSIKYLEDKFVAQLVLDV